MKTAFNCFFIFWKKQYSLNCASRADCQEMCYGHVCGAGFHKVHARIRNNYDLRQTKPEIGMSFSLQATLTGKNY